MDVECAINRFEIQGPNPQEWTCATCHQVIGRQELSNECPAKHEAAIRALKTRCDCLPTSSSRIFTIVTLVVCVSLCDDEGVDE